MALLPFPRSVQHVWTVEGGRLAGRCGPQKAMWDLDALKQAGFTAIVSLECDDPNLGTVAASGLRHVRICVEDFAAPTLDQIRAFNDLVGRELAAGGKVLAHCYAGRGRTGTMIASRLILKGRTVEEAVREVRARILETDGTLAGAIETVQLEALHRFAGALRP